LGEEGGRRARAREGSGQIKRGRMEGGKRKYRVAWSLSAAAKRHCTPALEATNRAYFSILPINRFSISNDTMDTKIDK
jgi:hypothetical protein